MLLKSDARISHRPLRLVLPIWLLLLLPQNGFSATYWVSAANGDDASNGLSVDQPFATVTKCADTAMAGDVCLIRAGTYRETVRPESSGQPGSPITFKAYANEVATISGADEVTPGAAGFGQWQAHAANIYRIVLPASWVIPTSDAQPFSMQVFVSDTMMAEARWPDVANPTLPRRADYAISVTGEYLGGKVGNFANGRYSHPGLASRPDNFFAGARMALIPGYEWWGRYGMVTASSGDHIDFSYYKGSWDEDEVEPDDPFMLWGKLEFLDSPQEYFVDETTNTLYVWVDTGVDPNTLSFTVKRREKTVDLTGRSHIRLEGLRFSAGRITMGDTSTGIVLERIRSEYGNHHMYRGWAYPSVQLKGVGNVLSNSEILKTGTSAITIKGANHTVSNNVIHESGYIPMLSDGIQVQGAEDTVIENNSIFNTSNVGISAAALKRGKVVNNRVFNIALQKTDIAAINAWNGGDAEGTEIAWNIVHDVVGYKEGHHWGGKGIRLDSGGAPNANSNYLIHHNLIYNTTGSSIAVWAIQSGAPNFGNSGNIIVNNTMDNKFYVSARAGTSIAGTVIANNIVGANLVYRSPDYVPDTDVVYNNLFAASDIADNLTGDPQFISPEQYDFRLAAGSPAIDEGITYPPFTDGYSSSTPDLGALEHTTQPFSAGATLLPGDLAGLSAACDWPQESTNVTCRVTGLPPGRFPGWDFRLRVGPSGIPAACTVNMDQSSWDIFALCDVDLNGGAGSESFYASLDGIEFVPVGRLPGDVNCDGTTDRADAMAALKTVADSDNGGLACSPVGTDVDGDNRFGLAEAIHALGVATQ